MKVYLVLFLSLLFNIKFDTINKGQIDSLKPLAHFSLTGEKVRDTININRLNKIASDYFESNPDSTIYYSQISIDLSRKINYQTGLANGLLQAAHANYFKGKFEKAKQEFDEAIAIFKKLKSRSKLSECYMLYGKMYSLQAKFKLALEYLNLSLKINEAQNNKPAMAECYKNIGMVYFGEGQLSTALDYYYKTLFIDLKSHNNAGTADIYNNIGDVLQNMEDYPKALEYYRKAMGEAQRAKDLLEIGTANENIGEVLLAQKNYDKAIMYLSKAIKIAIKQDDKDGISYINADLGLCYANKKQFALANNYLNTALTVARQNNIVYNEAYALISYAAVFNLQKDYKNACKYALKGQELAVGIGNLWFQANAAKVLYEGYSGLRQFEDAFKFSRQYNDLKDSLKNNESIQKLTSFNLGLNFTAKQQQLELLQLKKDITYKYQQKIKQQKIDATFILIIIAMVIITVFYYGQRRRQQKTISMLGDKNSKILQQKTDLDNQAHKLNDFNDLKDRLIAILAHDLRAPLSTLRGLFSLLQDETISHSQMLEMIPNVLKKLEYTSDFLDTLLFWINSQMENFETVDTPFLIKNIVVAEVDALKEPAAAKGIRLIDNVPADAIVSADPNSIRIVIRNLFNNAIKFSSESDTIEIALKQYDAESHVITVKDTGTGMSSEQLNKLFKSKVNSKTGTHNESGTGMGLLFCKDLVEKCKGRIWVDSRLGYGTEFSFTIPIGELAEVTRVLA